MRLARSGATLISNGIDSRRDVKQCKEATAMVQVSPVVLIGYWRSSEAE
jgi:hypothetical protein